MHLLSAAPDVLDVAADAPDAPLAALAAATLAAWRPGLLRPPTRLLKHADRDVPAW